MKSCVVIDDDPLAIEQIKDFLGDIPGFEIYNVYTDAILALEDLTKEYGLDYLFLDINLPGINGLNLAVELRPLFSKIIFITAHSRYAFNAFEIGADGYLLKPFNFSRFKNTLDKLQARNIPLKDNNFQPFFFLKSNNGSIVRFQIDNIIAVQAGDQGTILHTKNAYQKFKVDFKVVTDILCQKYGFSEINGATLLPPGFIKRRSDKVISLENGCYISL